MDRSLFALLAMLLAAGCASRPAQPPGAVRRTEGAFPANGLVTQRGVLTAFRRQYALNGYVTLSETGGHRLLILENFGKVLADVLVKPDGRIYVMQSSRALSPKLIRRYVAADLECIFGNAPATADGPLRMVGTNHFRIERRWYSLDLRVVESKPGPQNPELFDEARAEKK